MLPGGGALPEAVARHLLDHHADRLPDLSGLTVLVPNQRAGQDLTRVLAEAAGCAVLVPPHITPLKSWAAEVAHGRPAPQARRLAQLHGVLRREAWLGNVDRWTLAGELLALADELSAARLGGDIASQLRALHSDALDRETALIEAVWQALNRDGHDPQAHYARALDALLGELAAAPSDEASSHSTRPASGQVAGYPQPSPQMGEGANAGPKAQGSAFPHPNPPPGGEGANAGPKAQGSAFPHPNPPPGGEGANAGPKAQGSAFPHPNPPPGGEGANAGPKAQGSAFPHPNPPPRGEGANAGPKAIYGYALGPLTAVETQFLARCAEHAPVTLLEPGVDAPLAQTLHAAWQATEPPLIARAAALAQRCPVSPLADRLRVAAAPHLEAEARAVAAWVAEQLQTGRRAIALIALDRETARRVRALLERLDVLAADETGWTLSTTAAAAVIDRWLECVASDFPHVELLDLLKSPFVLGHPAARQDAVLAFELALRRHGVSQGTADMRRLAQRAFGTPPDWLATLFAAREGFARNRAPLAVWLARLADSLAALDALAPLEADAAGARVLDALATLRRDLADDTEPYSFAEWRRWLNRELETLSFIDASVDSPVVLTSLPAARGRRFDAVAVIGADARHLPPHPAPGLFSQATRAQLGLPTASDDAAAATADLMQLLVQGPALLSWQAWHDDEPNPASPLVLRLQALHRAAWGSDLPAQPAGEPPAQPSPPPAPCRQPAPTVAPAQLPRHYSPTAYQTLLDCPYRFFARSVLGLAELDEADEALDKSDYGNALHRILKAFHDSDPPHVRDAALAQLSAISAAEFAALPAWTAAAWQSQWEKIQPAYVDAWLAWVAQGWRYESGETDFAVPHHVEGLGEVTLHGRVDRVDVRGEARTVIDYKTSAAQGLKKKLKTPDEAVQLPFYGWLCEAAAVYLPINEAPVAALELDGETDVAAISLRLPELLKAIAAHAPLPARGVDSVCAHCEARGLCRKGMWDA
ncbi:MAG: PD-(D/E)XK nuclease family protein [Pseudomonadota bacterium]